MTVTASSILPVQIEIPYRAFPLTEVIHRDATSRIRVVCFGRRSGKSLMALMEGFCMSLDAYRAGVRRPRGVITAPTNEMLRENWWAAQERLKHAIVQSVVSEHRIDLGPLGQIDFKSTEAQGGAGRGSGYNWAVIDEASRTPKEAWEGDLRPALADQRGRALIISTPKGLNWFYDLYQQGLQGDPTFRSWRASTLECWDSRFAQHPDMLTAYHAEWDLIRRTTSESRFREEYLAEFLQSEGQLFSLKPALFRGILREAIPGRHYVAGVDVARKEDWMATNVIEVESQQLVALTRSRHQDWALQKAACLHLLERFPSALVYVDSTGVGDPIAYDLRQAGVNVMDVLFTPKTKSDLIENLLMAIDQTLIGIPQQAETEWLIDELRHYESTRMPSGAIRYGAPEGRHDDGVTALMLAAWGLNGMWKSPSLEETLQPSWWDRDDAHWDWLDYEHRLHSFRQRFPQRALPVHPTDLAWTLVRN